MAMVVHKLRPWRSVLAVMVAALGLLTACGPTQGSSSQTTAQPQPEGKIGGTLRVATLGADATEPLDPARTNAGHTNSFVLYDRLTKLEANLKISPELAVSWTPNADMTQWTFSLVQGVKWHDGQPFTARDVVRTITRILDPKTGSVHAIVLAPIESVSADGDYKVIFRLKSAMPDLPDQLASSFASIIPAHVTEEEIKTKGIGTGPFVLSEYVAGERLVATRNPNYWKTGYPKVDKIQVFPVGEPSARINGLRTGVFDIITDLSPLDARTLKGEKAIQILTIDSGRHTSIDMVASRQPFNDSRVRKAMKLVIDRERMLQQVLLGQGTLANDQPIPPFVGLGGKWPAPARSVELAKDLLKQAGYPNGFNVQLFTSDLFPGMTDVAVVYKEMAAEAGIRVDVVKAPASTYLSQVWGQKPMFVTPWEMRAGDALLGMVYHSKGAWNVTGWKNDDFDAKLVAARSTTDADKRKQLFDETLHILADDGPAIIPMYQQVIEAASTKVRGYEAHPVSVFRDYRNVTVEK